MHSAAPRNSLRALRVECGIDVVVLALVFASVLASPGQLAGQTAASLTASDSQPAAPSAVVTPSSSWIAPPMGLPPMLVPPPALADGSLALQDGAPMVPVLFGIFGGIAGMFVGDWWADRECGSDCGVGKIGMLFLAGGLGAMTGWVIGGGEIPQPPPERWP